MSSTMYRSVSKDGAVVEYSGDNMMCTYPCGHVCAVLTAPKVQGDEHGLYPGWSICPTCG
jgi:hypothetical protein